MRPILHQGSDPPSSVDWGRKLHVIISDVGGVNGMLFAGVIVDWHK